MAVPLRRLRGPKPPPSASSSPAIHLSMSHSLAPSASNRLWSAECDVSRPPPSAGPRIVSARPRIVSSKPKLWMLFIVLFAPPPYAASCGLDRNTAHCRCCNRSTAWRARRSSASVSASDLAKWRWYSSAVSVTPSGRPVALATAANTIRAASSAE